MSYSHARYTMSYAEYAASHPDQRSNKAGRMIGAVVLSVGVGAACGGMAYGISQEVFANQNHQTLRLCEERFGGESPDCDQSLVQDIERSIQNLDSLAIAIGTGIVTGAASLTVIGGVVASYTKRS